MNLGGNGGSIGSTPGYGVWMWGIGSSGQLGFPMESVRNNSDVSPCSLSPYILLLEQKGVVQGIVAPLSATPIAMSSSGVTHFQGGVRLNLGKMPSGYRDECMPDPFHGL